MRVVLVLTAIDVEARGLARFLALPPVPSSDFPHYAAGALEIACVGLRAAHIARAARCRAPALVISAGTCGALVPSLAAGDLVVPETVLGAGGVRYATAPLPGSPAAGTLVTVGDVVHSGAQKTSLWMESGALAVDMESAVILAWAQARGLLGAVVRAVSDTSERGVPADLAAVVAADGRVRTLRAVSAVLARPRAAADAMALRTTTNAALKVIAQALGRIVRLPVSSAMIAERPPAIEESPAMIEERAAIIEEPPGAIEERPGAIEEPPGATQEPPGAIEEPPGATQEPPGAIEERPGFAGSLPSVKGGLGGPSRPPIPS